MIKASGNIDALQNAHEAANKALNKNLPFIPPNDMQVLINQQMIDKQAETIRLQKEATRQAKRKLAGKVDIEFDFYSGLNMIDSAPTNTELEEEIADEDEGSVVGGEDKGGDPESDGSVKGTKETGGDGNDSSDEGEEFENALVATVSTKKPDDNMLGGSMYHSFVVFH